MGQRGLSACVAAVLVALGCEPSEQARQVARGDRSFSEATREDVRDLDRALDAVEARLLRGRASTSHYTELADRHQHVSALACLNAEEHATGIARNAQRDRQARADLARHRLAAEAVEARTSDAASAGYRVARPRVVLPRAKGTQ